MSNVMILADSTCDLSYALLNRYGIRIIPLNIVMDGKSYADGLEITPNQIYEWADANNTTPKTAAPGMDYVAEVLQPLLAEGNDLIFLGISEKMSTTCNVVRLVGQELCETLPGRIFVVDTQNLTTGAGMLVLRAAELARQGKTAEEIVASVEADREKVRASFVVDTLTYLARGGRCSTVTALMGGMLRLHPMIQVKDGAMGVCKKYRGSLRVALNQYVNDLEPALRQADPRIAFITHGGCDEDIIEEMRQRVEALNYFEEVHVTHAGGVVCSHCGYGTLGVLYCEK